MNRYLPKTKWWKILIIVSFYLIATITSFYLLPKTTKFERKYEIGKPWTYGLVTAPMDFPVYKLESEIKTEQDSTLKTVIPFAKISNPQASNSTSATEHLSDPIKKYLQSEFEAIYNKGVISINDYSTLKKYKSGYVYIIGQDNTAKKTSLNELYTMRTAYGRIVSNAGNFSNQDKKTISEINIDKLLDINITIDKVKTDNARKEAINSISPTMGVVQKGEKIIDKGEVIDMEAFKNLRSLEHISSELNDDRSAHNMFGLAGKLILLIAFFTFLYSYFYFFRHKEIWNYKTNLFMLLMSITAITGTSSILEFTNISVYIIPFAILPIVVRIFFDSRTALFLHIITILVCSLMVPSPFEFIILQLSIGIVAVSSLRDLHARSQLMISSLLILLTQIIVYTAFTLSQGISIEEIQWNIYAIFALNTVLILFAYGLIWIVEKLFGFLSSMTLLELSNVNTPLLMDFSEKCPGTFQHVLQVSNLAVEVAKKINADMLLVRTGALYHDIGKMESPMLYIENQAPGINPISELEYDKGAQIIISHVLSGIKLAQKHRLPKQIVDFIAMHHGTSKTRYFYNSFKNKYPEATIDEALFTYPGPLPNSQEAVIVMMADAIEAASRSLKNYNEETIDLMVENIVKGQIEDGQYKNAPISFLQVEMAKDIFKKKLKNIYHNRISYPELNSKKVDNEQTLTKKIKTTFSKI